jgi:hypothetical protein
MFPEGTMRPHVTVILFAAIAIPLAAASIQTTKPEEVGLFSERLQRIHQTVQRHMDEHDISGAVTLVQERPAGGPASPGTPPLFYTVPATREITIQDLLTHVSGLASGGAASAAEAAKVARKPGEKLADYIPRSGTTPLDFQPDSRWSYSPGAAVDALTASSTRWSH